MSRAPLVALAGLSLLAACSGGGSEADPDASSPVVDPGQLVVTPGAVIGQGRAVTAASATGAEGVAATTIGIIAIDGSGQTQPIPTALDLSFPSLAMSPDGQIVTIVSRTVGAELWSTAGAPTMVTSIEGAIEAAFTDDSLTAIVTTPSQIVSAPATGEAPTPLVTAPAGAIIVDSSVTGSGSVAAAALRGDPAGSDLALSTNGVVSTPNVFADAVWEIARAEITDAGDRVVVSAIPGDPFRGVLASVSVAAGAIEWQLDVGPAATDGAWAVGTDGRILIASDASLRLIGVDGSIVTEEPIDPGLRVTSVVATSSGYVLATADGSLRFTDLGLQTIGQYASTGAPSTSVQRMAATDGIIAVDSSGTIRLWDATGALISESSSFRASPVNDVDVSPDDALIAYGTTGGDAVISDIQGAQLPNDLVHPEGNVESVAFSADGASLLTGVADRLPDDMSFDDTISLWNIAAGQRYFVNGGQAMIDGMATFQSIVEYTAPGEMFGSSALDFSVSLRRADDGELIHTFPGNGSAILDLAFSPTGDRLVTSADAGMVQVWDTESFELVAEYAAPAGGYWAIAFMPDGERLVVSDLTGTVSMIDVADGTSLMTFDGVKSRTSSISVSPDGALAAAGTDGTEVRIWSTATGQVVTDLTGHTAPVTSTTFSPDGSTLVSGSQDTTVRVWSLA